MPEAESPKHPSTYTVAPVINALKRDAERTVVEMVGGRAWTGAELLDAIHRFAQALVERGASDGARVALLARNSVEVVILHNAIALAGCCLVSLHPLGSADDHLFAIEDGGVEFLIYEPEKFDARVTDIARRTNRIKSFLAFGDGATGENLLAIAAGLTPRALPSPSPSSQMTRLSYSGGTTGQPKAIPGNARVMGAAFQIMLCDWEWPLSPRTLAVVPLSHAGGTLFVPTLLKQGTLVVLQQFEPGEVLTAIEKYRINAVMLVPTMIYALLDHPDFSKYDLSSLGTIFYGASLMSPTRLKEGLQRIGPVFFQFYGQAEAPMTVMTLRKSEHDPENPLRLASCGRPVPWVDVALLDNDGKPVTDGEPGEICVRGPLVMDGYLNRDQLNQETFAGGWLHTGDVAVKDPDGFYRIVDRKKDMIVTGGFNVFPSEVENVIANHASVAQVAVFGTPDQKWGEAVSAAVVLRPGASADPDELIALVREHKGAVQAPKKIFFVTEIPTTAVGKPDKKALRKAFDV